MQQQSAMGVSCIGLQRGVVESELIKIGQNNGENFLRAPGISLRLEQVLLTVEVFAGSLRFDEKPRYAADTEVVVWTPLGGSLLFDDFSLGIRKTRAVLHIPPERAEQGTHKICTNLCLRGIC